MNFGLTKDFTIQKAPDKGATYVYDIEVEDTHTFFGNDILLHNSIYVYLGDVVEIFHQKNIKKTGNPYTMDEALNLLDDFCERVIQPKLASWYDDMALYLNSMENKMVMKREVIAQAVMWRAKKKYIMSIIDNEGVRYAHPKIKDVGVETSAGATPDFVKEALYNCYRIMLNGTNQELLKEISRTKREFLEKDYKEYSFPISISDLEKNINDKGQLVKGASWNAKAAYIFNKMLEKDNITYIPPIKSGDKINILYLKEHNPFGSETIAYVEDIPEEWNLGDYVDTGKMFERFFLNPVKSFSDYLSWHTNQVFDPSIYENSDKPKKVRKKKSEVAGSA